VRINRKGIGLGLSLVFSGILFAACGGGSSTGSGSSGSVDANETAAKVNGTVITMQEVDRAVKQQAQGQESKLSPLELAGARLQVLQTLIEQEVMFQKAQKEGTVPSDDDITVELNKRKTQSGKSADQIEKDLKEQGLTEAAVRDSLKKELAIQRLVEKITGKIEPPKDTEIEAFYNGNKEAFVKKRGVKLAAIVIDPTNAGEGDSTIDEPSAVMKANEIIGKLRGGQDFAQVARENSEDQTRFQGGDLGYLSQEDLTQAFGEQTAANLMNAQLQVGGIITARSQGKLFILKMQERSDKDEAMTLESPGVRQQVADSLVNNRKQLLAASYQAVAMNEASVTNYLAQKVVANPNELSGARPAGAAGNTASNSASSNTASASNTNAASNSAANANAKPTNSAANSAAKPSSTPGAKAANTPAAKPAANSNK
jgi:parvulin-like peptidyl-prolyl isomerase